MKKTFNTLFKKTPNILFLLVYTLSVFACVNTYAADESDTFFTDYTTYKKSEKVGLLAHIKSLKKGDIIRGEQFYFSDKSLCTALENALEKGVIVSLNLEKKIPCNKKMALDLQKKAKQYTCEKNLTIKFLKKQHAKIWLFETKKRNAPSIPRKKLPNPSEKNLTISFLKKQYAKTWLFAPKKSKTPSTPRKKTSNPKELVSQYRSDISSANASNRAHNNFEIMASRSEAEIHDQLADFIENPPATPTKKTKKAIIEITPPKPHVFHSYQTELNASRIARIQSAIREKNTHPYTKVAIEMCTMNINDPATIDALGKAAQTGIDVNLYLDKDAISAGHKIEALTLLSRQNVHIFIFDAQNSQAAIMHSKGFLRSIEDKNFLEISTANATGTGDCERNHSFYEPNPSHEDVAEFHAHLAKIKHASTPFNEIDLKKALEARKKRKTPSKKRKRTEEEKDEEKPASTKKSTLANR
ncbi:MAG: hypothetical protein NT124_00355 [Candidatus Dependentiae bacterium]|nr:hypothetical protein [Candidatus Dependentiae bacterium]